MDICIYEMLSRSIFSLLSGLELSWRFLGSDIQKEIQVDLLVFCIKRWLNIRPESMDMCWHVFHQLALPDPEHSGGITDSTWPGEV